MASDADEDISGDEDFDEDMEALRRACLLTGTDPDSLRKSSSAADPVSESEEEDDFELVRGIREKFKACCPDETPLTLKPLSVLHPKRRDGDGGGVGGDDDDDDDFAVLRSIQKRFSRYDNDVLVNNREKQQQVHPKKIFSDKGTPNDVELDKINTPKAVPVSSHTSSALDGSETVDAVINDALSPYFTEGREIDAHDSAVVSTDDCGFPKAAQMFVDAIRKNRACQKFIRNKMMKIEARIEENKKLQYRVKTLRGFQIKSKKETSRALSQKQDARYQLISVVKLKRKSKVDGKDSVLHYGPVENSQVACYKRVLAEYCMSLNRRKWTDEEREKLAKGIKQQFQELLLQRSVDSISGMEVESNEIDDIYGSIGERDITPENMRLFLPKVDWERLASVYLRGRSGAECEARWLNWEDPLINHNSWTSLEDKKLLHIVQQRGISNWIEIAVLLETNRTPFQCLARYQRSLNASVLRSEWSKDEDEKLRTAVAAFGESNWENVAATLVGRTGPQCSNRWIKSLNPARQKTGRWSLDEDKRVKVAVIFFGKNWKKVAQFVPGRTHVQCRERWANCLDPSLNMGDWTEEEDLKLKEAIVEHEYCWSKVAASVASRTDNQCTRRWKALFPNEVPLLLAARKLQKAALISNFVDRESERPALGPKDFIPLALENIVSESGELNQSGKQSRNPRSKKTTKSAQRCTEKVAGKKTNSKKKPRQRKNIAGSEATDGAKEKKRNSTKQKLATRSKRAKKEAQTDEVLLTEGGKVQKFATEKTDPKKKTRRPKKNQEAFAATEDTRIGPEIVPFVKNRPIRKRKMTWRYENAIKEAHICTDEIPLNYINVEEVEKTNREKKPARPHNNKRDIFEANDARVGEEIFDTEIKKKGSTKKQKLLSREGGHKDKEVTPSRATKSRGKMVTVPTNSRVSACGNSELITTTTVEAVDEHNGDRAGAKNKNLSHWGRKGKEQCKQIKEAASSFGGNEAFSEAGRLPSPHFEQTWNDILTEVNHPSPCPKLASLKNNVNGAGKIGDVGKRMKGSAISCSSRIKCRALQSESSDNTEIGVYETLASIMLEKETRCSLKRRRGRNHSFIKPGSIVIKEVDAVDEFELISEISKDAKKYKKREGRKPSARKSENAELEKKLLRLENVTHRGEKRKRSGIEEQLVNDHGFGRNEGDDMTLASLFKKNQKKRRLNFAPKTPPFSELSDRPAMIGLLDGHVNDEACDSGTCSPPPGFEKPVNKTDHLLLM